MATSRKSTNNVRGLPGTPGYRSRNGLRGTATSGIVKGQLSPKQWAALRRAVRAAAVANRLRGRRSKGKKAVVYSDTALAKARAQGYRR